MSKKGRQMETQRRKNKEIQEMGKSRQNEKEREIERDITEKNEEIQDMSEREKKERDKVRKSVNEESGKRVEILGRE